jgi:tetratricopeptide (TPR) repeat protein
MKSIVICLFLVGIATVQLPAKNANKEEAKSLIASGKSLENEGKLLEARAKYSEALAYNGGFKELTELNKKISARAGELVKSANASFDAKDFPKAIDQLQQAHTLLPDSPDVNCDLGVTYHAAGDDARAIESLHTCVTNVKKDDEKSRYEQLITQIETGDRGTNLDAGQKQAISAFNESLRANEQTLPTADDDAQLCKSLLDNQSTLPKTPAILFNLARCSEDAGKLEDAARYFSDYLAAAPDSRAVPEAKDASSLLSSILSFDGPKREDVRTHYRAAAQYLVKGRYQLALKEYEAVRDIAPDFAFGHRQLGLFYEALGRTKDATSELTVYGLIQSVPVEEKEWASKEIASFTEKRTAYDAAVQEAAKRVRPMLFTGHSGADMVICDEAIKSLLSATNEFQLAPDANRLLGYLYVEAGYPAGAKRAYDASTASDVDPFFFAWVSEPNNSKGALNSLRNTKGEVFSLVRVKKDGLQIEPMFSPLKRKKKSAGGIEPQSCHEVMDSLQVLLPQTQCGDFLPVTSVRHIESKQMGIEITTGSEPIWIRPVNLFQDDPTQNGPAGRKFVNQYVRVIQRYMENDMTKLGAEHMTGGEKTMMGLQIASIAMGGVSNAMSAVSSASAMISASVSAMQVLSLMQQYRTEKAMLNRPGAYKPIPVDPAPLAFRVE